MSIVDAVIIGLMIFFGISGLKNGFFKQTVLTIGTILVFVLSYIFKDYLANFFSYNLPFFDYAGPFQGLEVINIILYQMLAFLILVVLLSSVLVVLLKITGVFEKILKFTIILGIPSKILGFILGLVEGYIVVFVALFFLNQPAVNIPLLNESKYKDVILTSSPGLSNLVKNTNDTIKEMYDLVDNYNETKDANKFNLDSIDIMLNNKVITAEYVEKLIEKDKININGIETILNRYR